MKGIVFTEFLEMVEEKFGFLVADQIVTNSSLPSGGSYTAVGTYPHAEMVSLVVSLSKETEVEVPVLLKTFGKHLFPRFAQGYGQFFADVKDPFAFLESLEGYIHVEVKKLYPDAELPSFESHSPAPDTLVMEYKSERGMADFAEGLLEGCFEHFNQTVSISREDINPRGTHAKFTLIR